MYLNLFMVMGTPFVLSVVPIARPHIDVLPFVVVGAPLQAICVFYVVTWKNGVTRAMARNGFTGMMCSLGFRRQCRTEPVIPT